MDEMQQKINVNRSVAIKFYQTGFANNIVNLPATMFTCMLGKEVKSAKLMSCVRFVLQNNTEIVGFRVMNIEDKGHPKDEEFWPMCYIGEKLPTSERLQKERPDLVGLAAPTHSTYGFLGVSFELRPYDYLFDSDGKCIWGAERLQALTIFPDEKCLQERKGAKAGVRCVKEASRPMPTDEIGRRARTE